MSPELFATSGLVNFLVAVSLGGLVAFKNWKEPVNRLFFYMIVAFAVWSFSYWRWLSADNSDIALFWVHLLSIGSLFIPVFFFHWVIRITNNLSRYRAMLYVSYFVSMVTLYFSFSPLYIIGVSEKLFFPYWPIPGVLYTIYLVLLYTLLIGTAFVILIRSYLNSSSVAQKGQLLYIILGAVFGFGGGLTNFFLWYNIPFPPYGNFLVGAFPFFLGYSIVKHHLFNAKGIATEILVFFVSVALLAQTALSKTPLELLLRGLFFIAVVIFGYLIIRSVYGEVEAREKIEKLAKDLEVANTRLKELDQQKTEFLSFASHQLRAPLTAIKGYASMINEGSFGEVSERVKDSVSKIFISSQHLINLIEDFLNITRIELGKMEYKMEKVDLGVMAKDIIDALMPNANVKNLELTYDSDRNGPYNTSVDYEKIRQVLLNLIDNAIKYTPSGFVRVNLSKNKGKILLAVSDSGLGISPELKDRLFEKFSRGNEVSKVHVNGTGLGLFVAKEMMKAHGGDIRVESGGEGKGSTFFVEFQAVS